MEEYNQENIDDFMEREKHYKQKIEQLEDDLEKERNIYDISNKNSEILNNLKNDISSKEKSTDGFGTLTFVSPEVLIRKPYNKEVDIWSLGVILYLMLSGDLPFDDPEDNEQKIAKSIVYQDVKFPPEKFGKRSKAVIELIKGCLTKDPKSRLKIDEILKGEWMKQQLSNE